MDFFLGVIVGILVLSIYEHIKTEKKAKKINKIEVRHE